MSYTNQTDAALVGFFGHSFAADSSLSSRHKRKEISTQQQESRAAFPPLQSFIKMVITGWAVSLIFNGIGTGCAAETQLNHLTEWPRVQGFPSLLVIVIINLLSFIFIFIFWGFKDRGPVDGRPGTDDDEARPVLIKAKQKIQSKWLRLQACS